MLIASAMLFVILIVIATKIARTALQELTPEQKVLLVDIAAKTPMYGFALMVIFVAAWLAVCYFLPAQSVIATVICMAAVLLLSGVGALVCFRQMKLAGLPESFLNKYLLSRALRLTGACIFFSVMCMWLIQQMARQVY
ncbi:MAG: hypothetical protein ACREO1_15245 [Arenimonas sp.]